MHPEPAPGPAPDLAAYWPDGWDLTAQLARPSAGGLPLLPHLWEGRRPGDHDWSGPGGTCASCPAPNFLDAAGPCTWGA